MMRRRRNMFAMYIMKRKLLMDATAPVKYRNSLLLAYIAAAENEPNIANETKHAVIKAWG